METDGHDAVPVGLPICNPVCSLVRNLVQGMELPVPDPQRPISGKPPQTGCGHAAGKPEWNSDIKAYYDSVANEPIPDEILALMARLARSIAP